MNRNRARLTLLDILKEAHDDVVSLVFHPDTNELAGFWHRQGTLCIGPEYSLDEAMRTAWVQRELGEPRKECLAGRQEVH